MQPLTGPISAKDLAGGNYLKGSDIPDNQQEVRLKIVQFVFDPRARSKLVAQIDPIFGKTLWGLNVTNIRALQNMGIQDLQTLTGRTVVCVVGMAPNPQQGGQLTKTLYAQRVE